MTENQNEQVIEAPAVTSEHSHQENTEERLEKRLEKSPLAVIILVIGLILVLGGVLFWVLAINNCRLPLLSKCQAPISDATPIPAPLPNELAGTLNLTGLVPDATATGEIHIFVRPFTGAGGGEFIDTNIVAAQADGATWSWTDAVRGENYEVMAAYLDPAGQIIKSSPIETVTAPALGIKLNLDLDWADIPHTTATAQNTSVMGTVKVNGYVPPNSTLTLSAVPAEATDLIDQHSFTLPWPNGTDSIPFTWNEATLHTSYQLLATLKNEQGTVIGQHIDLVAADAGDHELMIMVNSTAPAPTPVPTPTPIPTPNPDNNPTPPPTPPPVQHAKLSGTVIVNGPFNVGSSILVLVRKPGEANYSPVTRITNLDNAFQDWTWDQAELGQQYAVTVALQVNENNTSTPANSKIVAAPAGKIDFVINTNFSVPRPPQTASAAPCQRDGDKWKTTLRFPAIAGAGNYWVQVGSQEGFSDVFNQKFTAPNGDFTIEVRVDGLKEHFARYAYTFCQDCHTDHNFSSFSQSLGFTCE